MNIKSLRMTYVAAPSDAIPFPAEHFDVVCALTRSITLRISKGTIAEIKRVVYGQMSLDHRSNDANPTNMASLWSQNSRRNESVRKSSRRDGSALRSAEH
jgi:hypothetical protein